MTLIISAIGRKGGITKTSTATNLAAACARAGLFTVFIETDGQGNASSTMGVEKSDGFYDLIVGNARWEDLLVQVPGTFTGVKNSQLYMLPAHDRTSEFEMEDDTSDRMSLRIQQLRGWADVVVIDTSPGLTNVHLACYLTSDYVYLPTLCEADSVESLRSAFKYIDQTRGIAGEKPIAQVLGILPNRFIVKQKDARENYGMIRGIGYMKSCPVFNPVFDGVAWHEARTDKLSIFAHAQRPASSWLSHNRSAAREAVKWFTPFTDQVIALAQKMQMAASA